ncbi:MAG: carbohydrate kinase family protein [Sphingomonadaceae bacterium]|nr:carbohydrate kinase family protein [Sphingomonadaceae bacterium]
MSKKTLICGSLAFDNIMVFNGRFREQILPEQIHILNVAFLVPEMRREFGGCAGNIAYALHSLGGNAEIMATVGDDGIPYLDRLDAQGLSRTYVRKVPGTFTAQAFITTDLDDNQITAFHPGAMSQAHLNEVGHADGVALGIVAPDGRDAMIDHARQFAAANIPFIFDPGQGLPMFDGNDLKQFLSLATYACVNDYEAQMLCDRTGQTLEQLAENVAALIVTRGGEGAWIFTGGKKIDIETVQPDAIIDPTGCGDAFRGGLLFGMANGYDWQKAGRLASLMGSIKIAHAGPQNYQVTFADVAKRFEAAFGEPL